MILGIIFNFVAINSTYYITYQGLVGVGVIIIVFGAYFYWYDYHAPINYQNEVNYEK